MGQSVPPRCFASFVSSRTFSPREKEFLSCGNGLPGSDREPHSASNSTTVGDLSTFTFANVVDASQGLAGMKPLIDAFSCGLAETDLLRVPKSWLLDHAWGRGFIV